MEPPSADYIICERPRSYYFLDQDMCLVHCDTCLYFISKSSRLVYLDEPTRSYNYLNSKQTCRLRHRARQGWRHLVLRSKEEAILLIWNVYITGIYQLFDKSVNNDHRYLWYSIEVYTLIFKRIRIDRPEVSAFFRYYLNKYLSNEIWCFQKIKFIY